MSFHRIKLLAAAVLLVCGVGMGVGGVWKANAQLPPKPTIVESEGKKSIHSLTPPLPEQSKSDSKPAKKWEYYYTPQRVNPDSGIKRSEFEQMLADMEPYAWEFVGEVNMRVDSPAEGEPAGKGGVTLPTYVFRRPVQTSEQLQNMLIQRNAAVRAGNAEKPQIPNANQATFNQVQQDYKGSLQNALKVIDDQKKKIADLEAALETVKAKDRDTLVFVQKDLPLGVSEIQDILGRVAASTGMKGLQVNVTATDGGTLQLVGTKDQIDWAKRLIQTLSGRTDPVKPVKP